LLFDSVGLLINAPESGARRIPCQIPICVTHVLETGARKMESIYCAGFCSVCHG